MSWVQTPLPPVSLPTKTSVPAKAENSDEGQGDEGDAMMQDLNMSRGGGRAQEQQELDYDVGDDNDWGNQ